jgi:hypothetical protein
MANKISDEELNINVKVAADSARAEMDAISQANKTMATENKKLLEQKKALIKEQGKESAAVKELTARIEKNNTSIAENKQEHKKLAQGIDLTQKSMRELKKESQILQRQLDQEIEGTDEYKRLQKELGATKQRMYEMRQENFEVQKAMGSTGDATSMLTDSFSDLFQGLRNGNLAQAKTAIIAIRASIVGATKASLAFIATPLGAALAIVVAIGAGIAAWASYNKELTKYTKLVENITGAEGDLAIEIANRSKALQEVYGVEMQESINAADSLVKKFGITYSEAFDIIGESLDGGAAQNNEFFDSIKEYPTFFADMGYSAEQFANIINKGYDLKIYTDKLPDALKEADLSLREQTTATRDSLVNAFGQEFTQDIFNRINSGAITTAQALQEISDKADQTMPNVQQQAQLTADLMRGAGEDAGGFAKVMEAVAAANQDAAQSLTPLQAGMKELREVTEDLEKAKSDALASTAWIEMSQQFDIGWKKIQTSFYNSIDDVSEFFLDLKLISDKWVSGAILTIMSFPKIVKASFNAVKNSLGNLVNTFISGGDIINDVLTLNFDGALSKLSNFKESIQEELSGGLGLGKVVDSVAFAIEKNNERLDKAREASKALAKAESERIVAEQNNSNTISANNNSSLISGDDDPAIQKAKVKALAIIDVENGIYEKTAALGMKQTQAFFDQKELEIQAEKDAADLKIQIAEEEAARRKALNDLTLSQTAGFLGALAGLLGQSTKAGKAAAIAQALINTYLSITEALKLPFPANIPAVAKASLIGFTAVRNIQKQDTTVPGFEDGYYPWTQTVTRDDGKKYGAAYGGATKTGVVSRPTVFTDYLTGEGNRKELIVDSRTFSRLDPAVINHIKMASHGIKGYEEGFATARAAQFTATDTTATNEQQQRAEERDMMILEQLMKLNQRLEQPIKATAAIGFQEAQDIEALNEQARNSRNKARP